MNNNAEILSVLKRRYEEIPVTLVKVINSRTRDPEQFEMNVASIDSMGLLKPIRVNDRFFEKTGFYELICGEGRLMAHQKLNRECIPAEIVSCSRKDAYLQSLVENIARTRPDTMDFARELKRLYDEGWDIKDISNIACKPEQYIRDYIRLVEQGEDRLIQGVETGIFPISFAVKVAYTDDSKFQTILMDAFDEELVTTSNFRVARQLLSARANQAKSKRIPKDYTVSQMRQEITEATKSKSSYVREVQSKENRFMLLLEAVKLLWTDAGFQDLVGVEQLESPPELAGDFNYK